MRCDVVVVGAGLAGLSAARDLAAAGTDVLVIEARGRAGGRVEQTRLDDGRLVQLGGELVGSFHTAYLGLVEELGLTVVPGFGEHFAEEGQDVCMLADGRVVGSDWPWFSDADRAATRRPKPSSRSSPRASIPTIPGRTRTPIGSTGSRSGPGCAPSGRRRTRFARGN